MGYTLWLFVTVRHGMHIEIDGLPNLKMVIFHGYVTNNQMVCDLDLHILQR